MQRRKGELKRAERDVLKSAGGVEAVDRNGQTDGT
jgi:hypothetical protein